MIGFFELEFRPKSIKDRSHIDQGFLEIGHCFEEFLSLNEGGNPGAQCQTVWPGLESAGDSGERGCQLAVYEVRCAARHAALE
jgi:hypothetical protein